MMYRPAKLGGLGLSPDQLGRLSFDKIQWHWKRLRDRQEAEYDALKRRAG